MIPTPQVAQKIAPPVYAGLTGFYTLGCAWLTTLPIAVVAVATACTICCSAAITGIHRSHQRGHAMLDDLRYAHRFPGAAEPGCFGGNIGGFCAGW